uniref:Uncharacterized protein n=1 Tax=Mycena chlorophos TaxID=658473 RepID=A0ABQ0LG12_MYCCL|nr:predicted protein [Mycena chlorophos]
MATLRAARKADHNLDAEERARAKLANSAYPKKHAKRIAEHDRARRDSAYEREHGPEEFRRRVMERRQVEERRREQAEEQAYRAWMETLKPAGWRESARILRPSQQQVLQDLCGRQVVEHIREGNTEEELYNRDFSRVVEVLDDLRQRLEPDGAIDRRVWATQAQANGISTVTIYLTSLTARDGQAWPDQAAWLAPWASKTAPVVEEGATVFCVANMLRTTSARRNTHQPCYEVDWLLKAEFDEGHAAVQGNPRSPP